MPRGCLQELGLNAELLSIDIIAVQEHRFYQPDDKLKCHDVWSYQLVTTSAYKNSVNATVGGIGFVLSQISSDNLLNIELIAPRIMVLELEGNPKLQSSVFIVHTIRLPKRISRIFTHR